MPLPKPHDGESEKDFIARCMGDETVLADFGDQEQRSGVCFSQWRDKESKEATMVLKVSDKNKERLLQAALVEEYGLKVESPIPKSVVVAEVFEDRVIYNVDGQLYEATYEITDGQPSFGDPTKVTSTTIFTKESMSMENRRTLLDAALHDKLNLSSDDWAWIEDMTETEVFYNRDRQAYKAPYTISEAGEVTIGNAVKVTRQVVYKSLESLQAVYSDVIQEAGKRNASMDAARVKKIVELCRELLSSEAEPEEKQAKEALKEATAVLKWLKTQEAEKTEDGIQFPAQAYAYVPDVENPSGWKLRLWEDLEKKVTRGQLGRASAYLSPGGRSGEKVHILAESLAGVKTRIRAEYRKLDVGEEDIPRWVSETLTRERILNFVSLTEAKFDKGRATVIVIKPGFNESEDRYYPVEMLKRDFGIFEGQKMYADHPTEEEDQARPERSIKDWVATLTNVTVDEAGVVTGIAEIVEPWLMLKLASLRDKDMLSEMGISINAVGSASKGTIDGKETLVIEKLVAARSVDFVTEPGAGGIVTFYESDRGLDIDLVELSVLKEHRPDLVKIIEATVREEIAKEVKKAMESEERITELEGQVSTLTTENQGLKDTQEAAEKDKAKAEAQATIKEAVDKAELPDAAKAVLIKRFEAAESADGIAEAIQAEEDYIAKLSEAGKGKGLGPTKEQVDKDETALRESLKRTHPEYTDEQLEAAVAGR